MLPFGKRNGERKLSFHFLKTVRITKRDLLARLFPRFGSAESFYSSFDRSLDCLRLL